MRISIVSIPAGLPNLPPVVERITTIARDVERLGFHGLWATDAFARGKATLDPLLLLSAAAAVTNRIELGTCVLQVPLRHPVELAHRATTLHALSGGRFRFGVGSGSTKHDFDAVEADYDRRFKTLTGNLEVMRKVWAEEPVYGPALTQWPGAQGGPPVLLGAWRSERWINLSAKVLQGWISSGIHTSPEDLAIGVKMFREAGGKRAVLANIFTDFRDSPAQLPFAHVPKITLFCSPAEARDRLRRLEDTGLDDALLVVPPDDPGQLETIARLVS
jgi:alkanesulfonate monooxygenase SsuD/methylene tetrahydromethanopterin reductase-like flavin-dependent oxidoreductase (luciferase family)